MSQTMSSSQAKAACQGAGVPEHVLLAAEMKAIPFATIWAFIQNLLPLLQSNLPALWEAVLAIIKAWPQAEVPVNPTTPVTPG